LADREAKKKAKIQTVIDQRMVNQKDPLLMIIEVISLEIIEENRSTSDVTKRDTSNGTV